MIKNLTKKERCENLLRLKSSCTKKCGRDETDELKKFYMNRYGGYMSSKIISVLFMEFFAIIVIMQTGIDSAWASIPYADTIIYGTMWSIGGLYLLQMMIRVVLNTYDLKKALDNGDIKVSECLIELCVNKGRQSNETLDMYINLHKKNELLSINRKSKFATIYHNINSGDLSGTKLLVYNVEDKKGDMFIMVKGRRVGETADRMIGDIFGDTILKNKVKLSIAKDKFKNNKK